MSEACPFVNLAWRCRALNPSPNRGLVVYPKHRSRKVDGSIFLCYLKDGRTEARVGSTDKMGQKRALARASARIARRARCQICGASRDDGALSTGCRARLASDRSPLLAGLPRTGRVGWLAR